MHTSCRYTRSKRVGTDLFAGSEELHVPNVCFLAVHLDLGGGLDLVLQECPCTHAAISRAEYAAQRWGATHFVRTAQSLVHASHLGVTRRVWDRCPLKGLCCGGRDQGAGDELPHPCACRHIASVMASKSLTLISCLPSSSGCGRLHDPS